MAEKNNEDIKLAASQYDQRLDAELTKIDEEIKALGITVPDKLTKRIGRLSGLRLHKNKSRNKNRTVKVATLIMLCAVTSVAVMLLFPNTVTAVRNVFRELFYKESDKSVEITMEEIVQIEGYIIGKYEDFELTDYGDVDSFTRCRFDSPDKYVEVNIYPESFKLVYDNENFDTVEDVLINGYDGRVYSANSITTIIINYDGRIVEIESDLPESDIRAIAENLKEQKEDIYE